MTVFALSGLLSGIACTVMAGLVYFTSRRRRANRLWALLCLAVSVWGLGAFLIGSTAEPELARVLWRIVYVGVIPLPALFYHFVIEFTGLRRPKTLLLAYGLAALFLLLDTTPLLVRDVRWVFGEFYYKTPGPAYPALVAFFLALAILAHLELWRAARQARERAQRLLLRWLFAGTVIGFAGGSTSFLPAFGLDLYPYGNFAVPLFPFIMTYAFLRHRLMDARLALTRGLTFLATYTVVVGVPFVAGAVYRPFWESALGTWWWVAPMVLMGVLASGSPVFFLSVVRRLEQRLWQAQRRYHRTLVTASNGMTRIKETRRLCRMITHMVNRTVGLANTSLFLYEPKEQRYVLQAVRYPSLIPRDLSVRQEEPLVGLLQEKKDLVVLEELEDGETAWGKGAGGRGPGAWGEEGRSQEVRAVSAWMRRLEARLIVPSFSNERLLGFLVLGGKQSGEPYTTDDIALFSALANQAALAIENALFFEELRNNEAYMIQSEKLASLGQLASGMAHEIHNPLTIISGESQLYLERFKGRDEQVDKLLRSIVEECRRAADITRRILRFAKPAPADFVQVNLKTVIGETLTLAGYQVRMDRFECAVNVPEKLPEVRGNQNQLQEVLLNLILNACQAMGEKGGKLTVSATAEDSQVILRVEDNGPGIPAGTLRKVFDPFYTTKASGTGLGLFVTQRIVKAHGGTIELDSIEGKGTCFTIRLPACGKDATASGAAA